LTDIPDFIIFHPYSSKHLLSLELFFGLCLHLLRTSLEHFFHPENCHAVPMSRHVRRGTMVGASAPPKMSMNPSAGAGAWLGAAGAPPSRRSWMVWLEYESNHTGRPHQFQVRF
jgi:hypothetical protein